VESCGLDVSLIGQGQIASCFEQSDEPSCSIKCGEVLA